ncbi:PREDICTED: ethanolamine kinase 2 isoform X3 [Crocodylus porosus]|nr:PREDICTED: ethanolamine kinase 2 isoform X3 [Crocodylus porosus]
MAKMHAIHANGSLPKPSLWHKLHKFLSIMKTELFTKVSNPSLHQDVPSLEVLEQEVAWVQEYLSQLGSPVVLCHNDLLCKNIIYNETEGHVRFIDYEYTSYNYQAFDIGNHFNEFAGVKEGSFMPRRGPCIQHLAQKWSEGPGDQTRVACGCSGLSALVCPWAGSLRSEPSLGSGASGACWELERMALGLSVPWLYPGSELMVPGALQVCAGVLVLCTCLPQALALPQIHSPAAAISGLLAGTGTWLGPRACFIPTSDVAAEQSCKGSRWEGRGA